MSELQKVTSEAIAAAENRIRMAKQLQAQGFQIIKELQPTSDLAQKTKLLDAATKTVKEACAIEESAYKELIRLKSIL